MKAYIREWRLHLDKTQVDLAKKIGVTKGEISRLENGFRRMTVEWMTKIADALGISTNDLLSPPPNSTGRTFDTATHRRPGPSGFPIVSVDPSVELVPVVGDEMSPT